MSKEDYAAAKRDTAWAMIGTGHTNREIHDKLKSEYNGTISTSTLAQLRKQLGIPSPGMNDSLKKAIAERSRLAKKKPKKKKAYARKKAPNKPAMTQDDVLVITGNSVSKDVEDILNDMLRIFRNEGFMDIHIDVESGRVDIIKKQEINLSFGG